MAGVSTELSSSRGFSCRCSRQRVRRWRQSACPHCTPSLPASPAPCSALTLRICWIPSSAASCKVGSRDTYPALSLQMCSRLEMCPPVLFEASSLSSSHSQLASPGELAAGREEKGAQQEVPVGLGCFPLCWDWGVQGWCSTLGAGGSSCVREAVRQLRAAPQQHVPAWISAASLRARQRSSAGAADARPISDCRHHLCEPDMKLVWPSAKLLQAAAGASLRAYHRLTSSVLPLLLEQYTKHPQVRGSPGSALTLALQGLVGAGSQGGDPVGTLWPHRAGLRHSCVPAVTMIWVTLLCPRRAARGGQSWKCCWASWSCSRSGDVWKKVRLAGPSGGTRVPGCCWL